MRDIPMFITENGAAGLVLREIPYRGSAYITIHDTLCPEELLRECVAACKMAGARCIYATGHRYLEEYPLHTEIWKMSRNRCDLPRTDAVLIPLTEENLEQWREQYNGKMIPVPNGAAMTREDGEKLLERKAGYYVRRSGELIGLGIAAGNTVESVISLRWGSGGDVLLALCGALQGEWVELEVASANLPALRLYDRLGFEKTAVLSKWYEIENELTRKNT